MKKKSPLKKSVKKLLRKAMNECEKQMKLAVHRRDKVCQICRSDLRLQCDHWISRRNKSVYYDIRNLTLLCGTCHTKKSFGYQDYTQKVTDVVFAREGKAVFELLRKKSNEIKKWNPDELLSLAESYRKLWTWTKDQLLQTVTNMTSVIRHSLIIGSGWNMNVFERL